MLETNGKFYLGRSFDLQLGKATAGPVLYDPADLTTHAVVVGMTGSGKTGLCIDLLEEAALQGIPALMIDPKGDITNALLHFPDLAPQDFQPWINPDQARRAGQTLEQAAAAASEAWREGLESWDLPPERLRALQNSVEFAVYTPGSDAGLPVSIVASLKAPRLPWEGNREVLREEIAGTVTALLGLVGLTDIDPVRSREHILLANIFEHAWSQGQDLDLSELILQTQNPPFARLGVFDVNTFFPEKDRFSLAMLLNNMLAAPAFQSWIEGQPLDIASLLFTSVGRPRHSIFYIAHLGETERMFFVTLLFSAVESWMRAQAGSAALRAILYFDEIYGYLPPSSNPPSKQPMLRMLKQARAFGVGLVLATQNPVDLDYKALSNAGTWFIGKLQTDQDKQRLLDGLEGAAAGQLSGGLDRSTYDRLISSLGPRIFLLHNIHQAPSTAAPDGDTGKPTVPGIFQTRWAMNYLAGPLTRLQIPALNRLAAGGTLPPAGTVEPAQPASVPSPAVVPVVQATSQPSPAPAPEAETSSPAGSTTRPVVPVGVLEYVLPNNLTFTQAFKAASRPYPSEAFSQGLIYHPVLLAQASVRFANRKYGVDYELKRTVQVKALERRGLVLWEQYLEKPFDPAELADAPDPRARFSPLETPLSDAKTLASLQKDFLDWAYRTSQVTVRANEGLKVYAGPQVSVAEFHRLCAQAARAAQESEEKKVNDAYSRKIDALQARLEREQRELHSDETELSERKMEELGTHAENVFSLFSGRRSGRRLSTSLTKRRLTEQAKAEVEESEQAIAAFQKSIAALKKEQETELETIRQRWDAAADQIGEITLTPLKKDVLLDLFGVGWMPYYRVEIAGELIELPGYGS
jgi:hypothetical protein